eukprot:m.33336 g.33336  ORF g.33336 m.33336 type:complete len:121 (-) comp5010_c0_seq1:982-1344(-)
MSDMARKADAAGDATGEPVPLPAGHGVDLEARKRLIDAALKAHGARAADDEDAGEADAADDEDATTSAVDGAAPSEGDEAGGGKRKMTRNVYVFPDHGYALVLSCIGTCVFACVWSCVCQ